MHTFKPATYFARQMPESTFGGIFAAIAPPLAPLWGAAVWDDAIIWPALAFWGNE